MKAKVLCLLNVVVSLYVSVCFSLGFSSSALIIIPFRNIIGFFIDFFCWNDFICGILIISIAKFINPVFAGIIFFKFLKARNVKWAIFSLCPIFFSLWLHHLFLIQMNKERWLVFSILLLISITLLIGKAKKD